jgi:hypothetical protein
VVATEPSSAIPAHDHPLAARLRAGLLGLAALGIAGTAVELWTLHHWESASQLIPWAELVVMAVAVAAVAVRPRRTTVRAGLLLGAVSVVSGAYGIVDHISSNLSAGPLDRTYGPRWQTMSAVSHWWAAASGKVGPAPVLAPGVLAQIGLCLLLACAAHPRRGVRGAPARRGS